MSSLPTFERITSPAAVDLPRDRLIHLKGGKITEGPAASWFRKAPDGITKHANWMPGLISPETRDFLPTIAAILDVIAPHIQCIIVAKVLRARDDTPASTEETEWFIGEDGREWNSVGGLAFSVENTIFLMGSAGPWALLRMMYHEVGHCLSPLLSYAQRDAVADMITQGIELPSAYLDNADERFCRWLESYAMVQHSGVPQRMIHVMPGEVALEVLADSIMTGGFINQRVLEGKIRLSDSKMVERGLVLKSNPVKTDGVARRILSSLASYSGKLALYLTKPVLAPASRR